MKRKVKRQERNVQGQRPWGWAWAWAWAWRGAQGCVMEAACHEAVRLVHALALSRRRVRRCPRLGSQRRQHRMEYLPRLQLHRAPLPSAARQCVPSVAAAAPAPSADPPRSSPPRDICIARRSVPHLRHSCTDQSPASIAAVGFSSRYVAAVVSVHSVSVRVLG